MNLKQLPFFFFLKVSHIQNTYRSDITESRSLLLDLSFLINTLSGYFSLCKIIYLCMQFYVFIYFFYFLHVTTTIEFQASCIVTMFLWTCATTDSLHLNGARAREIHFANFKLSLSIFGLASYKCKVSFWSPNGINECHKANSLLRAADNWLRLLQVNHSDYTFFVSHNAPRK